jgi:hypothetical protein
MPRPLLAAVVLPLALAACTAAGPRSLSDPGFDLGQLQRFAWRSVPRDGAPVHPLDSELLEKRVARIASDALVARGLVRDDAAPQFTLRSALLAKDAVRDGPRVSVGFGIGSIGRRSSSSVAVGTGSSAASGTELTLLIEARTADDGRLVWQGWRPVEASIGDADGAALERAVRAILAGFPPRR